MCALERTVFLSGGPKKPHIFISRIIASGRRHSGQVQISRVCPQRKCGTVSRGKVLSSKSPLPEKKRGPWTQVSEIGKQVCLYLLSLMDLCVDTSMFSLGSKNKSGVCVYVKETNPETDRNTSVFSIFKAKLVSKERAPWLL